MARGVHQGKQDDNRMAEVLSWLGLSAGFGLSMHSFLSWLC